MVERVKINKEVVRHKIKDHGTAKNEFTPTPGRFANPMIPKVEYDPELAAYILQEIAHGRSLRAICREPGMPTNATVVNWALHHENFAKQYTRAQLVRADGWSEELHDIADDSTNDWVERWNAKREEYEKVLDRDHIERCRLRIETRKWYLARIMPKRFGDATMLKLADNEGNKLTTQPPTFIIQPVAAPKREDGQT